MTCHDYLSESILLMIIKQVGLLNIRDTILFQFSLLLSSNQLFHYNKMPILRFYGNFWFDLVSDIKN